MTGHGIPVAVVEVDVNVVRVTVCVAVEENGRLSHYRPLHDLPLHVGRVLWPVALADRVLDDVERILAFQVAHLAVNDDAFFLANLFDACF